MTEETQAQAETQAPEVNTLTDDKGNEIKFIVINDVKYDATSFTKETVDILNHMRAMDQRIASFEADAVMAKLARQKLGDELNKELPNLTIYVDPEEVETAEAPDEPVIGEVGTAAPAEKTIQ